MYKENKESDLAIVQIQHYRRPAISGVGILQIKNWEGEKERKANYRREDGRDKSSDDSSIPWLLKGHEANTQPIAVVLLFPSVCT